MPHTNTTSFRLGDIGDAVLEIGSRLSRLGLLVSAPGQDFGPELDEAVRAFQQQRGLTVDGVVDRSTYRRLDEASWQLGDRVLTHVPGSLVSGDDVLALQQRLLNLGFKVGRLDGRYGTNTERGVREFQRNIGLPPDGTCGPATLKALKRLAPLVKGGRPNAMRAEERIRVAGPQLTGKIVVVDPATVGVPDDPMLAARATEIVHDLAKRVEGRLVATGVQAFLSHQADLTDSAAPGSVRSEADRAAFANRTEANLCVSLGVDSSATPGASGVSSYFYGSDAHGVRSSVGERFAGLLQREIVARTGLTDLRSHPKTWDWLRLTRMPAVRLDVGYLTNAGDSSRLDDAAFRDVVAEAIVVAVQRVYLAPESDPETGVLRLSELRASLRHS